MVGSEKHGEEALLKKSFHYMKETL